MKENKHHQKDFKENQLIMKYHQRKNHKNIDNQNNILKENINHLKKEEVMIKKKI